MSPRAAAARPPARSPSWCIIRVNPVGASMNGIGQARPSTVALVSTSLTSCSTWGWNSTRANARRARRSEISSSAAPSV